MTLFVFATLTLCALLMTTHIGPRKFLLVIILAVAPSVFADNLIRFEIKQQRADKALISFAQAANRTILFSFELTKKHQANRLQGYFSLESGLQQLLDGSGLIAITGQQGQINIAPAPKPKNVTPIYNTHAKSPITLPKPATDEPVEDSVESIAIIGNRVGRRSASELAVPVDSLSIDALENTGHIEVGRMLQTIAPSFNFSTSAVSDGTDVLRPATLRGLGLDQTLVLVNGKRRHQASLIHINTSVGRGTAGTDMNAIPAAAIKRIDVLRDGAAAQYGSDAIAGVINIVLNDAPDNGQLSIGYGGYTKGDGQSTNVNLSKGLSLSDNGYVNTTINFRNRGFTDRSGLDGACQFYGCISLGDDTHLATDQREISADRYTFRIGDADSRHMSAVINAKYELQEDKLYGFITYSNRENNSAAFFRSHANPLANPILRDGHPTIIGGYLPKIESKINDLSFNIGYMQHLNDYSSIDWSYTYGRNIIDYTTSDSINASYANAQQYITDLSPEQIRDSILRETPAYQLVLALQTANVDYITQRDNLTLAFGGELRTDRYRVNPGDMYSYYDYDSQLGVSLFDTDASAGSQGFGGISAQSQIDQSRDVISAYADVGLNATDDLTLNGAIRHDNYDNSGHSTNFKLSSHWRINEQIAVRGALSSGFRAPSMQQLYFSNISTQFIDDPLNPYGEQVAVQVGTFNNTSELAKSIGIPELTEEKSKNYSFGAIVNLDNTINFTLDWYRIDVDDRIVISNQVGFGLSNMLDKSLLKAGAGAGQFFLNGADTKTHGVDFIATWQPTLDIGELYLTFAANKTQTNVTKVIVPSDSALATIMKDKIFSPQDISIIEEWQPQDRISITSLYQYNDVKINLELNRYGQYNITDGGRQTHGAKVLTDIRVEYQIDDNLSINFGGNNIFDAYPDKNTIGNSHAGTIIDNQGNEIVSSDGVFVYSRRSAPFGFNGAYFYAGAKYRF